MPMKLKRDYRIALTLFEKTKPEERCSRVLGSAWEAWAGCPKSQMATFLKRLTPGQRAFLALDGLEAEVNNGGIHQYLYNSTGDLFEEALAGLKLIGAKEHLKLLKKVARLFPDPAVLRSHARRRKAVGKMLILKEGGFFDEPFFRLEKRVRSRLGTLQAAYLKKHQDEFVLPEGQAEETFAIPGPGTRDYRVSSKKAADLRGEKLHWELIEKIWDDYWEPLKAGKQEISSFLPVITRGQRALIAVDILNKVVLRLGGFAFFFGEQVGSDVVSDETGAGYRLLGAKPYEEVFQRAVRLAKDLPELARKVTDLNRALNKARDSGDEAAIQGAKKEWYAAYCQRNERKEALEPKLAALDAEFKALLGSKDNAIEGFIERYVDAHPEEFVR